MYYRVDYLLALLAAGALVAALLSPRAARIAPQRLAHGYLMATAALVALRAVVFATVFAAGVSWLPAWLFAIIGDLGIVLLGALYGIAAVDRVRGGFAAVLSAPELRMALCLALGIGFAMAGIGKAYSLDFMLDFFGQSHYTKSFLFVIMATEVIGGAVILLPWRAVTLAASAALAVVMFGAIYTHAHNHEPFDYSEGAVGMLLRLAPLAVICVGWRRAALGAAVCCAAAIIGSAMVRVAPATGDDFEFFVGSWQCSGEPAGSGAATTAALHVDREAGGRWLLLRLDERAPDSRHVMTEWRRDPTGWVASVQDETGGLGTYRATGWQGEQLVWNGQPVDGGAEQRFTYHRLDPVRCEVRHEVRDASGWRTITALTCVH